MAKTERKLPSCWQPVLVAKLLPDQNFIKGVSIQGAWLSIIISVPTSQRHKVFSLYGSSTQESRFFFFQAKLYPALLIKGTFHKQSGYFRQDTGRQSLTVYNFQTPFFNGLPKSANSYQDNYHIISEAYCIFFFFLPESSCFGLTCARKRIFIMLFLYS